jgi:hypothetical protein
MRLRFPSSKQLPFSKLPLPYEDAHAVENLRQPAGCRHAQGWPHLDMAVQSAVAISNR